MKKRPAISMSVVPGDPTDGTGRVCIHLFVRDKDGLFIEPHVLHHEVDEEGKSTGKLVSRPTRGRLACDRKKNVRPVTRNGVITVTHRSDDARAVTCPGCINSEFYRSMMAQLSGQ